MEVILTFNSRSVDFNQYLKHCFMDLHYTSVTGLADIVKDLIAIVGQFDHYFMAVILVNMSNTILQICFASFLVEWFGLILSVTYLL